MYTLVFNTTTKTVKVLDGPPEKSSIIYNFDSVPTVKSTEFGYYEVMQEPIETSNRVPVARFPISNTVMLIKK